MKEYLNLLDELIRLRPTSENIPAVNRAAETIRKFLEDRGVNCAMEELNGRKVLYASNVPGKTPDLLLNAHIDVVPAAYESQYEPDYRDDGWLYARGASDCLGNAVCIIKSLCEADPKMSIGAIFTSNEEIGGETTGHMVKLGYQAKRLIVVMDHWNKYNICCAQKGVLVLKLTAHGKGGHSSTPWAFDNPIDKLMDGYLMFRQTWKNPTKEDQWHSSMAATVISGGLVANQIPDAAEMLLNFRFLEPGENEEIMQRLREVTGLEVTLVETCLPVTVSTDAPELKIMADTVEEISGVRPGFDRMNGATDARWFTSLNKPIAIMGIEGSGAHAKVERCKVDSIDEFSKIIKAVSRKLSAEK